MVLVLLITDRRPAQTEFDAVKMRVEQSENQLHNLQNSQDELLKQIEQKEQEIQQQNQTINDLKKQVNAKRLLGVKTALAAKSNRQLNGTSGVYIGGTIQVLATGRQYGNCYAYVKSQRDIPHTRNGNAGTTPINSYEPAVGAAAVMAGHIAIVEDIQGDIIQIRDANYRRFTLTRRWVPKSAIKGYWL